MWYIVNTSDGKRYLLTEDGVTIGREACTILTPAGDGKASRRHALVRLQGGEVEVQDLQSTNGSFLDDQRIGSVAAWPVGQALRCGQTTFHLEGEPAPARSAPSLLSTSATMMSTERFPAPAAAPPSLPQQPAAPPPLPQRAAAPPPRLQQQAAPPPLPRQQAAPPPLAPAAHQGSAIGGIITGLILLIVGIYGWQHYQPQMNTINSTFGQLIIGMGGDSTSREAEQIKLFYIGSIVLACVGGITVLASAIRMAVARK
jgi:hypothetical protein